MTDKELDKEIIEEILKKLPLDARSGIIDSFSANPDQLNRLNEIMGIHTQVAQNNAPAESILDRWNESKKNHKNRFNELIERYLEAYLKGERETEYEPSRSSLENIVSNHSKWNRMINHHGQGRQYRDDIRRVCFVFRLTFPEANELMWSAGQFFDPSDLRDYIIIDCLKNGIYSMEKVDKTLRDVGVPELFPVE